MKKMKVTVSTQGQIVLPKGLRAMDGIKVGDQLDIKRIRRGEYRLFLCVSACNEGLIDHFLACPEKGFFVPVPSESTNSL